MTEINYLQKELYDLVKIDETIFDFIQISALDGLWYWDLENPANEWMNEKFWTVLGYNPEEMPYLSSAWQDIINQEDLNLAITNFTKHCENPNHPYDQVVRYIHQNGSIVWIRCRGMAIRDENGKPIRMLGAHHDITELKNTELELKESREQLRSFASKLQEVREIERANLAREIHDSLAQYLVALKMDMGMVRKKISKLTDALKQDALIDEIEQLIVKVDNANKSARSIMNGLRPEQLELLGFVEAAEVHLRDFENNHHIKCQFHNAIESSEIRPEQAITLFRILQESLHNVLKHAMATVVTVQTVNANGKLVMKVIDNGVGFDVNKNGRTDSYGLIGIKERVKLLNGNFDITSKIGKGTYVKVEIPNV